MKIPFLLAVALGSIFSWCDAAPYSIQELSLQNFATESSLSADTDNNAITAFIDNNQVFGTYSQNQGPWTLPVQISDGLNSKRYVDTAMDASGTGLAVWRGSPGGGNFTIESAFFNGTSWSTPTPPILDLIPSTSEPAVVMNDLGQGLASWTSGTNVHTRFFNGGAWGPILTAGTNDDFFSAPIAYSVSGQAAATWQTISGEVWANYFDGTSWQTPTMLSATGIRPKVGIDAAGIPTVIFNSGGDAFYSRFNGTIWSTPALFATGLFPRAIEVAPDGTALALLSNGIDLYVSAFNGVTWSAPVLAAIDGDALSTPSLAMDSAGNALIAYEIPTGIYTVFVPKGGAPQAPLFVAVRTNDVIESLSAGLSTQSPLGFVAFTQGAETDGQTFATFIVRPTPPGEIFGTTCTQNFATHSDRINIITFTPSTDLTVVRYIVRRDGVAVATIPAGGPFVFFDPSRCRGVPNTYTVTSVNADGIKSDPLTVTLR